MFRKTFIRLILVIMVASTTLVVFAAARQLNQTATREECKESVGEDKADKNRTDFFILESLQRTLLMVGNK